VIADRTAHDVIATDVDWNSRGQPEYLLIYRFKLKPAFPSCRLLVFCG